MRYVPKSLKGLVPMLLNRLMLAQTPTSVPPMGHLFTSSTASSARAAFGHPLVEDIVKFDFKYESTLCNNGHLACFVCCIKLKKRCSFCKLPIGDVRCRAMEKVIKAGLVSCSNAMYGCKESTAYGNKLLSHERVCVFAPCSCPVKDCNYIGSYKDLNSHFRGAHKRSPGYIFGLELRRSIIFCLEQDVSDQMIIFQEEKEGDVIVVESFTGSEGVYVTVSHIAPTVPGVRKFSSSLARIQEHSTLRLGLRVKNIQKWRKLEEQPEDDFLLIPSYMLSGVHIKMEISIGNEDAYVHV
ncbi:PREDICTED: E3 ubiquitin-protein ligase SINA-like 4 [Camelina sativa]|uniref:E3 ubiquitin-protein ligase SINA-like 4 n=1 Tax=Camelina sativa TaxID=90675 RepID=A0ABM0WPF7_CAMSA|nr:PREDICTED: E3 ubiquitin-protein ligase SINA-like 4 [Camelina sativa]